MRRIFAIAVASLLLLGPTVHANPAAPIGTPLSVTLITGDRVTLSNGGTPIITPAAGRERIRHTVRRFDDHLYVVPEDATQPLATGRLDRQLFDVAGLIRAGYDDSRTTAIPLIVQNPGLTTARADKQGTRWAALRSAPGRIWLDSKRRVLLDRSVPQIGAPAAWQAGWTGKGITVAVLDTGIDIAHPDLASKVAERKNFSASPDGDHNGHGTHVASTIAGSGAASDGRYRGVAPDATLLDGTVCEADGTCLDSAILAGMRWAAVEKRADIVNLSIGARDTPGIDPLEEAVNTLTAQTGTLFVVAAGNSGPGASTLGSPGTAEAALTVGAVDAEEQMAEFSSRGPRLGDAGLKPDLTAPGVAIVAARADGSGAGEPVGEHYQRMSGTSMATPHVAGAAALLAQRHPSWTAAELKPALIGTARFQAGTPVDAQGAGRVDVAQAVSQSVRATPASLGLGIASWPHDDDPPIVRQLTYHNAGGASVELRLSADLTGPGGQPGAISLSTDTLTVPANGSATVTVTVLTSQAGPDGRYAGRVVATADGIRIGTPVTVEKETEQYRLTIDHRDENGEPAPIHDTLVFGLDTNYGESHTDPDGVVELRLRRGRYLVVAGVQSGDNSYRLVHPNVELTKDTTVAADARLAKPVSIAVDHPTARSQIAVVGFELRSASGRRFQESMMSGSFDGTHTAALAPPHPSDALSANIQSQWAVPGPDGTLRNTPLSYGLVNTLAGRYYTGFTRKAHRRTLAKVVASHHQQVAGRPAEKVLQGYGPGMREAVGAVLKYDLPVTTTHYLEPGAIRWRTLFREMPREVTSLIQENRQYAAGRQYAETWNAAVFGPALPGSDHAIRIANFLDIRVPMFSDRDGRAGLSRTDRARTTLHRAGTQIGASNTAGLVQADGVPAEPARFQLNTTAERASVSGLSTRIDATWWFGSAQAGDEPEPLPLWTVRFHPAVDNRNLVRATPVTVLPLSVQAQPGAPVGRIRGVTVQVSGDDGQTWRPARVLPTGHGRFVAIVATPAGATHISLRARASDTRGNVVEQTILRGYGVTG